LKRALGRGLEGAAAATNKASTVQLRLDALDDATKAWAGRRMNQAIARALSGQGIDRIAEGVEGAKGVDAHVEEHERNRAFRPDGR
jgi:molecular chaperone HscA